MAEAGNADVATPVREESASIAAMQAAHPTDAQKLDPDPQNPNLDPQNLPQSPAVSFEHRTEEYAEAVIPVGPSKGPSGTPLGPRGANRSRSNSNLQSSESSSSRSVSRGRGRTRRGARGGSYRRSPSTSSSSSLSSSKSDGGRRKRPDNRSVSVEGHANGKNVGDRRKRNSRDRKGRKSSSSRKRKGGERSQDRRGSGKRSRRSRERRRSPMPVPFGSMPRYPPGPYMPRHAYRPLDGPPRGWSPLRGPVEYRGFPAGPPGIPPGLWGPPTGRPGSPPPLRRPNSPPPLRRIDSPPPLRRPNSPPPLRRNSPPPLRRQDSPPPLRRVNSPPPLRRVGSPPRRAGNPPRRIASPPRRAGSPPPLGYRDAREAGWGARGYPGPIRRSASPPRYWQEPGYAAAHGDSFPAYADPRGYPGPGWRPGAFVARSPNAPDAYAYGNGVRAPGRSRSRSPTFRAPAYQNGVPYYAERGPQGPPAGGLRDPYPSRDPYPPPRESYPPRELYPAREALPRRAASAERAAEWGARRGWDKPLVPPPAAGPSGAQGPPAGTAIAHVPARDIDARHDARRGCGAFDTGAGVPKSGTPRGALGDLPGPPVFAQQLGAHRGAYDPYPERTDRSGRPEGGPPGPPVGITVRGSSPPKKRATGFTDAVPEAKHSGKSDKRSKDKVDKGDKTEKDKRSGKGKASSPHKADKGRSEKAEKSEKHRSKDEKRSEKANVAEKRGDDKKAEGKSHRDEKRDEKKGEGKSHREGKGDKEDKTERRRSDVQPDLKSLFVRTATLAQQLVRNVAEDEKCWCYEDPNGTSHGPCSLVDVHEWCLALRQDPLLRREYMQFLSVAIWKEPQPSLRVILSELLEANRTETERRASIRMPPR